MSSTSPSCTRRLRIPDIYLTIEDKDVTQARPSVRYGNRPVRGQQSRQCTIVRRASVNAHRPVKGQDLCIPRQQIFQVSSIEHIILPQGSQEILSVAPSCWAIHGGRGQGPCLRPWSAPSSLMGTYDSYVIRFVTTRELRGCFTCRYTMRLGGEVDLSFVVHRELSKAKIFNKRKVTQKNIIHAWSCQVTRCKSEKLTNTGKGVR